MGQGLMDRQVSTWKSRPAGSRDRRILSRLGPFVVAVAVLCAIATLLIFADYTPIQPTNDVVVALFLIDAGIIVTLLVLLVAETLALLAASRRGVAGAKLHARIVGLVSVIAATPAILIAVVGSVTLERSLNPAFMQDVRAFIYDTAEAARLFREAECRSLLQEGLLTANDIDSAKSTYDTNRSLFHQLFASRVNFLGFTAGALMDRQGKVTEEVDSGPDARVVTPEPGDFDDAVRDEPQCLILDGGRTFVALLSLRNYPNMFLYVARPIDPFAVTFPAEAANLIAFYNRFDEQRKNIQIAFATMYVLLALILLLSATWLGLSFAKRLVTPIRRLIAATDQVSSGNLYVQVPVRRSEGDLAHLGETFNKMTSELRLQQNRLLAASTLIDERRVFTEAVLSGVPAAVIGVDAQERVTVVNAFAGRLLATAADADQSPIGRRLDEIVPELAPILAEAKAGPARLFQSQLALTRDGRERTFNVRVTSAPSQRGEQSVVVTLDDITDLVSAQRTSAWADVARRIAHEIKNPLTPIQLSAERLKRKYGRLIKEDREVFDHCTDTIVRQVDDIKRMVDEFSSFARMPRAKLEEDDLAQCVRQVMFLMRVGHPEITFEEHAPERLIARFDRRLLSQALTNIVKNATEGIAATERDPQNPPRVQVELAEAADGKAVIDVTDNGKGFPKENRQRLLEPYMTTRAEGTGLGLPIVAKILEDHGGGIELLDAPNGRGARVRLFFPLNAAGGEGPIHPERQDSSGVQDTRGKNGE
jgi:two-component system, NtrC family, nitrogen regulation sensor histidine kinase NtrY